MKNLKNGFFKILPQEERNGHKYEKNIGDNYYGGTSDYTFRLFGGKS